MAIVLTDAFVSIDATIVSGLNTNVAISYSAEAVDITAMGDETKKQIGGLKDWSIAFEFIADEQTIGAFFAKLGTVVPVDVRATSAARSTTNPSYSGQGLITEFNPLSGSVGDAHKVQMTVVASGELQRLTVGS